MITMTKKRWFVWGALVLTLISGLVGCSALDERQRQVIFNPAISRWTHTSDLQDIWIPFKSQLTNQPVRMHALWLGDSAEKSFAASRRPVVLYLHGARWDVWASRSRIELLHKMGFNVLAIDYRGFGQTSTGLVSASSPANTLPSESMAYEDAMEAWKWLEKKFPRQKRYIYGHSLGGAIAIDLASKTNDEAGTIVESTFTSVRDVFSTTSWGWLPVGPLLTQRFESVDKVDHIGSPLLVVHGTDDKVIKPELGERLFEAARSPKRMILVKGGNHHDSSGVGFQQYQVALKSLFGIKPPISPVEQAAPALAEAGAQAHDNGSSNGTTAGNAAVMRAGTAAKAHDGSVQASLDGPATLKRAATPAASGRRASSEATSSS